jgi:DNA-binding PadR family transcriptional regulator
MKHNRVFVLKLELEPSVRERNLRAFLDLVILCMLAQHPMSSYAINKALTREFGVMIGPTTIYSKLNTLKKHGSTQCDRGRSGNIYSLTEQGQQIVSEMPTLIEEICTCTKAMLNSQITPIKKGG